MEVSEEQKKKDKRRAGFQVRFNIWNREQKEQAISKLPNEFRQGERDWNTNNQYNGDSYCGLYLDE